MIIDKNDISIQEIKSIFENQSATVGDTIFDIMKCFKLAKLCRSLGVFKQMGYTVPMIVITLIMFPIMMVKTVRGFILSNYRLTEAQKDTFFRILNNEKMNWRKLLYTVAKQFRSMLPKTEEQPNPTCEVLHAV